MNESNNDEAVYRTAPATLGLLTIVHYVKVLTTLIVLTALDLREKRFFWEPQSNSSLVC